MCGIVGYSGRFDAAALREGVRLIRHRGPDDCGLFVDDDAGVGLGHARLSIIDLSPLGHQPMEALDGAVQLVFNGEIYNYRELGRADAESDTAVLLELLEREGEKCLPKLAGMFAFAFYRPETGEALLARDAFGIKPLYYRIDGDTLAFASEAKLLRRPGDVPDAGAVRDFFLWGSVPEPATVTEQIRQVPAGHFLR